MNHLHAKLLGSLCLAAIHAQGMCATPKAEVIHWWTSGGEAAAVRKFADTYRAAGGTWIDTAIAGSEQSRSVTFNRIVGGKSPTAAQFNTSRQFHDLVEQDLLHPLDDVAKREGWAKNMPQVVVDAVRVKGRFMAAPVSVHMPTWIWYSKSAFRKAGIAAEPTNFDELFAALDKLRAAGLVPLAHGGQSWQDSIVFTAVLANMGGRELYLKIMRDRDPRAIASAEFRKVLTTFKRLQSFVDPGSPGRNWNDATSMLISGKAGIQIIGDWAKGEFALAKQVPGKDYGCIPGFGAKAPYIIQGDVFVFPKASGSDVIAAQDLLAAVVTAPTTQVEFSVLKGSIPVRMDVDRQRLDVCAQAGLTAMNDPARQVGNGEMYMTPDQNGALTDVLTAFWNKSIPVDKVQRDIAAALAD